MHEAGPKGPVKMGLSALMCGAVTGQGEGMKKLRRIDRGEHQRAICRHCHQMIVHVDEVGWVDPDGGDTYDICPDDPYGNHDPQD